MGLQIWLPLIGDMHNQGMSGVTVTSTSATVDANGKIGSCMKIVQATELNYIPDPNTTSYSLCGWFKFNKAEIQTVISSLTINSGRTTPTGCILGNSSYGGIGIIWETNNIYNAGSFVSLGLRGVLRTPTGVSGGRLNTNSFNVEFDTWIHVCLTWDVETRILRLYRNGSLIHGIIYPAFSDCVLRTLFLDYQGVWSGNGPGAMIPFRANDIRVYNHSLSEKEVKEISKGLACHYKLESHNLKNVFSYPTFNTSATAGGWGHWGRTGAQGTQGQNTDKNYIFNKKNTYSHWVQNASAATGEYLLYQSPSFDTTIASGGYRTMVAIMKRDNGLGINDSVCFPSWNANVAASSTTMNVWTEIRNLGDGFYLGKCEGICQDGSNNLAGIYVCPGYKIYFSEVYLENYATAASYINDVNGTTDIAEDCSGYNRHGTFSTGTVVPIKTTEARYDSCIKYLTDTCSVSIGNLSTYVPSGDYTFNIWFRKDTGVWSSKGWETIFGGPSGYEIQAKRSSTNSPVIVAHSWGQSSSGGQAYSLDVWNMLTIAQNASNCRFFLNGSLYYTAARRAIPSGSYFIGSWRDANSQNYKGYFSDARIYATCLSDADILELYNLGASVDNKGNLLTYELKEA